MPKDVEDKLDSKEPTPKTEPSKVDVVSIVSGTPLPQAGPIIPAQPDMISNDVLTSSPDLGAIIAGGQPGLDGLIDGGPITDLPGMGGDPAAESDGGTPERPIPSEPLPIPHPPRDPGDAGQLPPRGPNPPEPRPAPPQPRGEEIF